VQTMPGRVGDSQVLVAAAEASMSCQIEKISLLQAQLETVCADRQRLEEGLELFSREAEKRLMELNGLETLLRTARAKVRNSALTYA
jgi:hypothetical protein